MTRDRVIRARAPLRISFAGGGTDVPPFPEREGGAVLSATIDRYAFASLRPRSDRQICVQSLDYGVSLEFGMDEPLEFDGNLDLVKASLARMVDRENDGFDLFLHSNAPAGTGLGASSAMVVALVGVLAECYRQAFTPYELAALAHDVERRDLGVLGGLQDHYAAVFGGFNFIEFESDHVVVNPLRIAPDTLLELQHNVLLVYTGRTRMSDGIIEDQVRRYDAGDAQSVDALRAQRSLASEMKRALLRGRLGDFGAMLDEAWLAKRRMSPRIATPEIDEAYSVAKKHGALGGKVTGAGGGGFMVFYCPFDRRHHVAEALIKLGMTVHEPAFEPHGLTTWRADG